MDDWWYTHDLGNLQIWLKCMGNAPSKMDVEIWDEMGKSSKYRLQ
jgi:hypothetical protein